MFSRARIFSIAALLMSATMLMSACGGTTQPASTPTAVTTVPSAVSTAGTSGNTRVPSAVATGGTSAPAPVDTPASTQGSGSAGTATGSWRTLVSTDKKCQIQIPPDWVPVPDTGGAGDPAFLATVNTSLARTPTDLAGIKKTVASLFQVTNVIEDTSSAYRVEYKASSGAAGTSFYGAVPADNNVCIAQVLISSDNAVATLGPIGRQIIGTLAMVK